MSVQAIVIEEAKRAGIRQNEQAQILHRSKQGISAAKNGTRRLTIEELFTLAEAAASPRAYMETVYEAARGIMVSPYLDGDNVELNFHAVLAKTIEELEEAIATIKNLMPFTINRPDPNDELLRQRVQDGLLQLIDAGVAIDHLIAGGCERYGINIAGLYAAHERKLTMKGYLKKKNRLGKDGR